MSTTEYPERDELFAKLRDRGIVKVDIEFSGGNDEGSADDVIAYYDDGTVKSLTMWLYQDYLSKEWTYRKYVDAQTTETRPATDIEVEEYRLAEELETPIWDQFSFDGDVSIYGTLTWDVATGKLNIVGAEQPRVDVPFEIEL